MVSCHRAPPRRPVVSVSISAHAATSGHATGTQIPATTLRGDLRAISYPVGIGCPSVVAEPATLLGDMTAPIPWVIKGNYGNLRCLSVTMATQNGAERGPEPARHPSSRLKPRLSLNIGFAVLFPSAPIRLDALLQSLKRTPCAGNFACTSVAQLPAGCCTLGEPYRVARLISGVGILETLIQKRETAGFGAWTPAPDLAGLSARFPAQPSHLLGRNRGRSPDKGPSSPPWSAHGVYLYWAWPLRSEAA